LSDFERTEENAAGVRVPLKLPHGGLELPSRHVDFLKGREKNCWLVATEEPGGEVRIHPIGTNLIVWSRFGQSYLAIQMNPDGTPSHDRMIATEAPTIHGLPFFIDEDGQLHLLLLIQYRAAVNKRLLECPKGFIKQNESAEVALTREIGEETGLSAGADFVTNLGLAHSSPSFFLDAKYYGAYEAYGLIPPKQDGWKEGIVAALWMTVEEYFEQLRIGKGTWQGIDYFVQDGLTDTAIMRLLVYLWKMGRMQMSFK